MSKVRGGLVGEKIREVDSGQSGKGAIGHRKTLESFEQGCDHILCLKNITLVGSSRVASWLGLGALTATAWVQSLVAALRPCKPCSTATTTTMTITLVLGTRDCWGARAEEENPVRRLSVWGKYKVNQTVGSRGLSSRSGLKYIFR